jgi:hypothetical protein
MTEPSHSPPPPWYRRELTRGQKIIALCTVGWTASMIIMIAGEYQTGKRMPPISDIVGYAGLSLILGPIIAWAAAWKAGVLKK